MKKHLSTAVSAILAAGMLLAGCGGNEAAQSEAPASGSVASSSKTESAGTAGEAATDEIVDIKWVTVGNGMPDNYDAWKANLDAYMGPKIGVHLDMEVIPWGDWNSRRNVIVSTNEPYDIMFTNQEVFSADVSLNAFADITDLVQTAAPDLYAMIPKDYWDACKINGKLYGVPTYKDSSSTQFFIWDTAIADKYGIDYDNMHKLSDLTDALQKVKDGEGITPFLLENKGLDATYVSKYDAFGTGLPTIGVSYHDGTRTVVPVFEQADMMEELNILHDWFTKGIINADAASITESVDSYKFCSVAQGWPNAAKTVWGPNRGIDSCKAIQYGDGVLSNDTVLGSANSVSASCAHPEKALAFLQLVNTDTYVRDALKYGLEGDNFVYNDDKTVTTDPDKPWPMAGYTQGTFFTYSLMQDQDPLEMEEIKKLNEEAVPSPLLGFSFDASGVRDKLDSCIEIFTRYRPELLTGTVDPNTEVPAMMKEMRAAGFDDILNEAQNQINAAFGQ